MAGLLVLTDTFSWEIAALGDLSFYLTLKTLFSATFYSAVGASRGGERVRSYCSPAAGNRSQQIKGSES